MTERAFPTPEEAAMAEWAGHPGAEAFVVSVEYVSEYEAIVVKDTKPSHPMWNQCFLTLDGWIWASDHN